MSAPPRISRVRLVLGAAGGLLTAFGVFRLVTEVPGRGLLGLAVWLAGALVLHDAVLSPAVLGIGAGLRKVPARGRTYLQGALIAGGTVTVVAVPMIYLGGSQPRVKALLTQDYRVNLALLLVVIAAAVLSAYLLRIVRDRRSAAPAHLDGLPGNRDSRGREGTPCQGGR
jgi:hypothetical protein